ncbi:MAG: hypothetical protein EPO02_13350 [Nitrospirae bacterium]|nr:MAG: hypothetical protein EPO02_13350 [Nitrospirota bacterium]
MPDLPNLPLLFDTRKIETSLREAGQFTFFNLTSTDDNAVATGNNQNTAYPIRAANTYFSSVPAGTGCLLPQTSRPTPLDGLLLYITNADPVNSLLCYPHPNDPSNSINKLGTNAPVVLGPNSMTPFVAFNSLSELTAGKWIADGIGAGAAGSVETIISQGAVATAGTNQATATPITQAMVNFTSGTGNSTAGGTLMAAFAGLQISVGINITATQTMAVYPAGTDTINGVGGGAAFTTAPAPNITIFMCFTNGAWFTK